MAKYEPGEVGFLDETSKDERTPTRAFGRAKKGRRATRKAKFVRGRHLLTEALLTLDGIVACTVVEGSMTKAFFLEYLEHNVVRILKLSTCKFPLMLGISFSFRNALLIPGLSVFLSWTIHASIMDLKFLSYVLSLVSFLVNFMSIASLIQAQVFVLNICLHTRLISIQSKKLSQKSKPSSVATETTTVQQKVLASCLICMKLLILLHLLMQQGISCTQVTSSLAIDILYYGWFLVLYMDKMAHRVYYKGLFVEMYVPHL
jgi:hypothetical protein